MLFLSDFALGFFPDSLLLLLSPSLLIFLQTFCFRLRRLRGLQQLFGLGRLILGRHSCFMPCMRVGKYRFYFQ